MLGRQLPVTQQILSTVPTTPELGNRVRADSLWKNGSKNTYIFVICKDEYNNGCGNYRWIRYYSTNSTKMLCSPCSIKKNKLWNLYRSKYAGI